MLRIVRFSRQTEWCKSPRYHGHWLHNLFPRSIIFGYWTAANCANITFRIS